MRKYILMSLLGAVTLGACTDNFAEIDSDKSGITAPNTGDDAAKSPAISYLSQALRLIYPDDSGPYPVAAWVLQVQSNLNIDIWAGYLSTATNFQNGRNNQSYELVDGWNSYMLDYWNRVMAQTNDMRLSYEALPNKTAGDKTICAMGIITRIISSERTADMYGTIPYLSYGSTEPEYSPLDVVYNKFFEELDEAQELLSQGADVSAASEDLFYKGRKSGWSRLANTLRLRLAMRIVKADPEKAREEAQKAIAHSSGLILDNSDNAAFTGPYLNGLCVLAQSWGDTRMSADMESIMGGYEDPRLSRFFSPVNGKYSGVRVGSIFEKKEADQFSSLGTAFRIGTTYEQSPVYFATAAESYFLLAEAALRGFAGATDASEYYNNGVRASMQQWGITDQEAITEYLNSQRKPSSWSSFDSKIASNVPAESTITPRFSDASDNESKLEKIITQKWIAMFPAGSPVAWSEYRRTGYPRMLPPYRTFSKARVNVVYGPKVVNNAKRAAIPTSEYESNYLSVSKAVAEILNGSDKISTPVWWDVDVANF
ncbi:MAG: SusD/RagB family nutrient-binding outer membrane lipoprotein [Bacteroidales bacterium]